jgi:heme oxygenase (biliverdin-producing, ferredoxin)
VSHSETIDISANNGATGMSNLRELTKDSHTAAERSPFVKVLFSGKIDPELYAIYLKNLHSMYETLELCAMPHGLFDGLPDIRRATAINEDFLELWGLDKEKQPSVLPVVDDYIKYISSIKDNPHKLMAHIYVRHMGDLSGGQMIAKRVPGSGRYYRFGGEPEKIKAAIRSKLDDDMAEEAKVCFGFAARLFDEMMEVAKRYE